MNNNFFLLILFLSVNLAVSRGFIKSNISNKKNNTHRTFLIRTELNKTEIEKLFKNNNSFTVNQTIISEINNDNETFAEDIDIEIEDEIHDNGTMPYIIDFLTKQNQTSEEQALLSENNQIFVQRRKIGKFLFLISLIIFIYAMIYFNGLKKSEKLVKVYKFFELDFKEEKFIVKNE